MSSSIKWNRSDSMEISLCVDHTSFCCPILVNSRHTLSRYTERQHHLRLRGVGQASLEASDTAGEHTTETVGVEAATEHLEQRKILISIVSFTKQ